MVANNKAERYLQLICRKKRIEVPINQWEKSSTETPPGKWTNEMKKKRANEMKPEQNPSQKIWKATTSVLVKRNEK